MTVMTHATIEAVNLHITVCLARLFCHIFSKRFKGTKNRKKENAFQKN